MQPVRPPIGPRALGLLGVAKALRRCEPVRDRATAECRLLKPVYDGTPGFVPATEAAAGLDLRTKSQGAPCAPARAALAPDGAPPPPTSAKAPAPPAKPRPADETTLAIGPR